MKIVALIKFGEHERSFVIPCGAGNKTFKWLGNVASQRFTMATPNGNLRRREQLCSGADSAQYQAKFIKTPMGDMPNPTEFIVDHLHDGDEVIIELCDVLTVHSTTDFAQPSNWTSLAYSLSQSHLESDTGARSRDDDGEESDAESSLGSEFGFESMNKIESHVNFVKIMLKSQQVDVRAVERKVDKRMILIERCMPKIDGAGWARIRATFCDHWDLLTDVYTAYTGETDAIAKDSYTCLVEDATIFPAVDTHPKAHLIYHRTCERTGATGANFNMECFLISLILASQLKYNDTCGSKMTVTSAQDALTSMVRDHIVPLAHRLDCLSVLKSAFFTNEVLVKVRYHYDILQDLFTRTAAKQRDVPTAVNVVEFCEVLYCAGLLEGRAPPDQELCRRVLQDVRKGTIFGREADAASWDASSLVEFRHDYPDAEFTFAEFVEAAARSAYHQHLRAMNKSNDESVGSADANVIVEQMARGITALSDFAQGKVLRSPGSKQANRTAKAVRK